MIKPYFKTGEGQPSPLRIRIKQKVRFEEIRYRLHGFLCEWSGSSN